MTVCQSADTFIHKGLLEQQTEKETGVTWVLPGTCARF